jgi:hypothetical protein
MTDAFPVIPDVRRVVYTAIFGGYEVLDDPGPIPEGWARICFTDGQDHPAWRVVRTTPALADPWRSIKILKLLPHRVFPNAECSLWIDGNFSVRCDLDELVSTYLRDADVAVHAHPDRDCAYDEALLCMALKRDVPGTMHAQMLRYAFEGFPRHAGLTANGVLLRRHTDAVRALNELWLREVEGGSRRDQLSFTYAAWRLGVRYAVFDSHLWNGPLFANRPHAKVWEVPDD